MAVVDPHAVTRAFGSAKDYDGHAVVQKRAAAMLAQRIARLALSPRPTILEIGCGTGLLTREMLVRGVTGQYLVTDKSAAMVGRAKLALCGQSDMRFAVLDAETDVAQLPQQFDLICASMAMQWFADLPQAVSKMVERLAPGGHLLFNTLAAGTLHEWQEAHEACGVMAGAVPFPAISDLRSALSPFAPIGFEADHLVEEHDNARAFLRALKHIGAATSRSAHSPLPVADLRKVMDRFDRSGARVSYELVTVHIARAAI